MNEKRKVESMFLRFAPMCFYGGLNEERRKTSRTIITNSIDKNTSINRISVYIGNRKEIMNCNPKHHVMKLSWFTRVNSRFFTPCDRFAIEKCHHIINRWRIIIWIGRITNKRYMKSLGYYFLSYPKILTSNPSRQNMTTRIIKLNKEIRIEFSNQKWVGEQDFDTEVTNP